MSRYQKELQGIDISVVCHAKCSLLKLQGGVEVCTVRCWLAGSVWFVGRCVVLVG